MALTSLILFLPANLLPFLSLASFGQESTPTIWGGIVSLYDTGSPFLAGLVLLASIVLPLLKILVVLALLSPLRRRIDQEHADKVVVAFDTIGRWAMLDVFLLAIFVAVMKFGSAGSALPGPGAVLFAVVVLTTMASYTCMEKLLK